MIRMNMRLNGGVVIAASLFCACIVQQSAVSQTNEKNPDSVTCSEIRSLCRNSTQTDEQIERLRKHSEASIRCIEAAMQDPDWMVKVPAMYLLVKLSGTNALSRLVSGLSDSNANVRAYTADAMKRTGNRKAINILLQRLDLENDTRALYQISQALIELGAGMELERSRIDRGKVLLKEKGCAELKSRMRDLETMSTPFLVSSGAEHARLFDTLFGFLSDTNWVIRSYTTQLLNSNCESQALLRKIYEEKYNSDRNAAIVAARVLGKRHPIAYGKAYTADAVKVLLGIDASFSNIECALCGFLNHAVPIPPRGSTFAYYSQAKSVPAAFAIPVVCDRCSGRFYLVWDRDPR